MPILKLQPGALHTWRAAAYLEYVSLYPREDDDFHARLLDSVEGTITQNVLRRTEGKVRPEYHSELIRFFRGPRLEEVITGAQSPLGGRLPHLIASDVAAQILVFVLSCKFAEDPANPPTLDHAHGVFQTAGGSYPMTFPGLGRSEQKKIWADYAPAAHLSAAFKHLRPKLGGMATGRKLATILAFAEALRLEGEEHRPPKSSFPLLDPRTTWKIPDWLELPPQPICLRSSLPPPSNISAAVKAWVHPKKPGRSR